MIIELPQDWGNRLSEGTNKPVGTRTQEKEAVIPQETEQDFPLSVQEFSVEAWVNSGLPQGRGTEYNSAAKSPFEGDCHYHTPTIAWP